MGKRIVHCGEAGNGQVAKICNNLILGASMIAVSEAFVLGEKLGLSHQALFDVVSGSSGQCWSLTSYCPVPGPVPASPANNGYKPGFTAALMLKDLNLARQAAQSAGAKLHLARMPARSTSSSQGRATARWTFPRSSISFASIRRNDRIFGWPHGRLSALYCMRIGRRHEPQLADRAAISRNEIRIGKMRLGKSRQ